jgi:hypothetical protein
VTGWGNERKNINITIFGTQEKRQETLDMVVNKLKKRQGVRTSTMQLGWKEDEGWGHPILAKFT